MTLFERGTQVIYKPRHIDNLYSFDYPNGSQPGFVTSINSRGDYFVRYWIIRNGKPINQLRTKANSELTPAECIYHVNTVPEKWVRSALDQL